MEAKAKLYKLRMSPRKVRLVVDLIRNQSVIKAITILAHEPKKAAKPISTLLNSAIANATNNHGMEADKLRIKEIYVNEDPTLKRYRPRAHGRAFQILKRSSNVTIVVSDEK